MEYALIVNLREDCNPGMFEDKISKLGLESNIKIAYTPEECSDLVKKFHFHSLICFPENFERSFENTIKFYQDFQNCLPDFQFIVCSNPSPMDIMKAYEFGLEQFIAEDQWQNILDGTLNDITQTLSISDSLESLVLNLYVELKNSDNKSKFPIPQKQLENAQNDFIMAFNCGRIYEGKGSYLEAIDMYRLSLELNHMFRPAANYLGELLLGVGRVDEAVSVLEKLDRTHKNYLIRTMTLANAYCEKGDIKKAKECIRVAEEKNALKSKVLESKVHVLLATNRIGEAVKILDQLNEVGPHLASKLNEIGVKLSKAGKCESALVLYKKAHRVVKDELKYKISLNAALACHRNNQNELALKFAKRCKEEFGSSFPKLEKIEYAARMALK